MDGFLPPGESVQFVGPMDVLGGLTGWKITYIPSKIEWDLPNGPLTKLLELLDTKV